MKINDVEINDHALKARVGNFVVYDVDYLLNNLAREIYLLESTRHATVSAFSVKAFLEYQEHEKEKSNEQ